MNFATLSFMTNTKKQQKAMDAFMRSRGLNPHSWARIAGIREGTIRNFIKGNTQSMRYETLLKLADSVNATVNEILGESVKNYEYNQRASEHSLSESLGKFDQPVRVDTRLYSEIVARLMEVYEQENAPLDIVAVDHLRDQAIEEIKRYAKNMGEARDIITTTATRLRLELRQTSD